MNSVFKQTLKRAMSLTAGLLLLTQSALPLAAFATQDNSQTNPNQEDYWCSEFDGGVKFDSAEDATLEGIQADFSANKKEVDISTVDSTTEVGKVVVKAGSTGGDDGEGNEVYTTGTFQNLTAPSNKEISHVIVCYDNVEEPETGSLTIIKDAQPNSAKDFTFTTGSNLSGFTLDDDPTNSTKLNTKVFTDLETGRYTVTETATTGWTLDDIDCTDNSTPSGSSVTVSLAEGEDVTCTFTNVENVVVPDTGTITIIKDAVPNDEQDFGFTTTGTGMSAFSLDDDGETSVRSHTKVFSDLDTGVYSVTESEVDDWKLDSITCSGGASVTTNMQMRKVTINLGADENITCTFVNDAKVKVTLCHATGSESNPFVKITVSAAGAFNGHLGSDHQLGEDIIPTFEYKGETYSQNWDAEGMAIFRNNCEAPEEEPEKGSLTIRKQVNGGNAQDFEFDPGWEGAANFMLDDDEESALSDRKTFRDLEEGEYTVSEILPEEGWELTRIRCSEGANYVVNVENNSVTVDVGEGQNVTCTFTNKKERVKPEKVTLCHATGSDTNPFVKITVSAAGAFNGHLGEGHQNGEDIIPPFEYRGQTYSQNWDAEGMAIFRNNCEVPEEEPELGDVFGFKFHDKNSNGMRDSGEDKLSGWTIKLWLCEESEMPSLLLNRNSVQENKCDYEQVDTDVTNAHGNYSFSNLEEGWYKVCEVQKDDWTQTHPASDDGCHEFEVTSTGESFFKNFGNKRKPVGGGGQVLGSVTPEAPQVLVNTGSSLLQGIIVGMSILGTAAGITALSRRKNYSY
ncbi:MAG: hypothetical protein M3Q14_01865 [bacterium]|nr:hypothetical protein [bacterium]